MAKTEKPPLIFVCKTYSGDFDSFCRLLDSYKRHNVDSIHLYISVPQRDKEMFEKVVQECGTVVSDESYAGSYFTQDEYWGLSQGYINQEICKLSFWENDFADNYLCIDSDAYFIRDFYISDFMVNDKTPYSVLTMDKDLNTQSFYHEFGKWRLSHIKRIFETVGYEDRRYLTCHGMTVLNAAVLKDFKQKFILKKKLTYKNLIEIAPYEYTWYNAWLQKSKIIDVVIVEPFFKTFHMRVEYEMSRVSLISESNIADYYVGIIMNSNWKPTPPPNRYQNPNRISRWINNLVRKVG